MNHEAALDYLALEVIDEDLVVIPSDIHDLTDENELNYKDTATLLVCDVPGLVQVINADKGDGSDVPRTSADPNSLAKNFVEVAWKKKNPVYSKWSNQ